MGKEAVRSFGNRLGVGLDPKVVYSKSTVHTKSVQEQVAGELRVTREEVPQTFKISMSSRKQGRDSTQERGRR